MKKYLTLLLLGMSSCGYEVGDTYVRSIDGTKNMNFDTIMVTNIYADGDMLQFYDSKNKRYHHKRNSIGGGSRTFCTYIRDHHFHKIDIKSDKKTITIKSKVIIENSLDVNF